MLELEDLTPLALEEVEKFFFVWERQYYAELEYSIKSRIDIYLGKPFASGSIKYIKENVDLFNAEAMPTFMRGCFCQKAELHCEIGGVLSPITWPDYSLDANVWIDWYGMTSDMVDQLPRALKRQMMDKYLPNWRDIIRDKSNNQALLSMIQNTLSREFYGMKQPAVPTYIEARAEKAILQTGIVDNVKCAMQPFTHTLNIKVQLEGQIEYVSFTATIS